MPEATYTIEAPNQVIAMREAAKLASVDGIEALHVKVLASEPLFEWGDPKVRCIVLVKGPKIDD